MISLKPLAMRTEAPSAASEILLLDDRADEIRVIKGVAALHNVNVVKLCPEVLSFLRRHPGYHNCPRPDLILLDLNLSHSEHCETLTEIKQDPDFRRIPVVVMAGDDSPKAIRDAYSVHANAYVVKPSEPNEFVRVIQATLSFWLNLVRLPRD